MTNRGPDYKDLKQIFIDSILEVVMDIFPKINRDKVKIQFWICLLSSMVNVAKLHLWFSGNSCPKVG